VLEAVMEAPARAERIAHGQQQSIAALRAAAPPSAPCWTVPDQGEDLHDLAALSRLEAFLPAASEL
jgi:hypothetical protein